MSRHDVFAVKSRTPTAPEINVHPVSTWSSSVAGWLPSAGDAETWNWQPVASIDFNVVP
jgi:hypothetical protein